MDPAQRRSGDADATRLARRARSSFSFAFAFLPDDQRHALDAVYAWCRLVDDRCTPETCKFTQCSKGKLLSTGICAYTVKTKVFAVRPEQELKPIRAPPKPCVRP